MCAEIHDSYPSYSILFIISHTHHWLITQDETMG